VRSTLEPLEGNKVKLSVEVDEAEFDKAVDAAFRKIAREVRIPGFRPGKAPRRVLEARIGTAPAREQALRDAIPDYLAQAVRDNELDVIAAQDIDITNGQETGPVAFDATIEVRPQVSVAGYGGLRVELPPVDVTDEEIDARLLAIRRPHGELVDVDRPAARGDQVTLDLAGTRDGEPVPGLNTDDWLYEIGRGWIAPELDEQLIGATVDDVLKFTATPSGMEDQADFVVVVNKVQELSLPDLTDEWVQENTDASSVEALRHEQRDQLARVKVNEARRMLVDRTSAALAELVDDDAPETLVGAELRQRVENTVGGLARQGIPLEQFLAVTGQDEASFVGGLREASTRAVKVDLALRAVAEAEQLDATDADVDAEYARIAVQVGEKPAAVRRAYERNDAVAGLRAELRKSKALRWLLDHVEIVDTDGKPIERTLLLGDDDSVDDITAGDVTPDVTEGSDDGTETPQESFAE